MKIALNLEQVLDIIGEARTEGRTSKTLTGIASLDQAGAGDLSFLGNKKYRKAVPASKASVILLPEDYDGHPADNQAYVRVAHPQMALVQVCERIEKQLWPKPPAGIHPSAVVHPDASVNAEATIGPLCVIEAGAVVGAGTVIESQTLIGKESRVGRDCWIMPQVLVASYCRIGDRVRLHAGVVIGSDGFGYNFFEGIHRKEPQIGIVIVEDDVEIGANSTVDRARFSESCPQCQDRSQLYPCVPVRSFGHYHAGGQCCAGRTGWNGRPYHYRSAFHGRRPVRYQSQPASQKLCTRNTRHGIYAGSSDRNSDA